MRKFSDDISLAIYGICVFAREQSQSMNLTEEDVFTIASDLGGPAYVTTIIEELLQREMIRQTSAGYDIEYAVRPSAFVYVEQLLEDPASILSQTLNEASDADTQDSGSESDDVWQPLPIDRETPEYEKALSTVEDALEKIEQDNGYAPNNPEERDTVVWSLRAGLDALRGKAPSLSQVKAMILEPLNKAIRTFKEAAPGVAAMMAKEAIKEWIKSLFR